MVQIWTFRVPSREIPLHSQPILPLRFIPDYEHGYSTLADEIC